MSEEERIEQKEKLLNEVSEYLGRKILENDHSYLERTSEMLKYLALFLHRMRMAEKQGSLHLDWNKMNRLWEEEGDRIFVLQAKKMSKEEAKEDREYGWTDAGKY